MSLGEVYHGDLLHYDLYMIAEFPDFSRLGIEHQKELTDFTSQFEPYSDFNFTGLFCWNVNNSTRISFLSDNLVLNMPDYITGKPTYSILGKNKLDESLAVLLQLSDSLRLVPEIVIENISDKPRFVIEEDRGNHDYIVSALDLAELQLNKLPKKRSLVENFKLQYPNLDVRTIDLNNAQNKRAIMETFDNWRLINKKLQAETEIEYKAVKRLLDNSHHFPQLYAIGIYDGKKMVAFNTYETSTQGYGISSFQKADKRNDGIYAYLTHEMAKSLVNLGCEYINFEQDLDIEGLRNSKLSYHPVRFLKKYIVSLTT